MDVATKSVFFDHCGSNDGEERVALADVAVYLKKKSQTLEKRLNKGYNDE